MRVYDFYLRCIADGSETYVGKLDTVPTAQLRGLLERPFACDADEESIDAVRDQVRVILSLRERGEL